jgi:hypothetical protein
MALEDLRDAQVHVRRQPPVEAHLLGAVPDAALQRGEVQEPEVEWFPELVGVRTCQNHPRAMRLDQLDVLGRVGIDLGTQESLNQRREGLATRLAWALGPGRAVHQSDQDGSPEAASSVPRAADAAADVLP